MMIVSYSKSLGDHIVKARSLDSAWNTLLRKHRAKWVVARVVGQGGDTCTYQVTLVRRDTSVAASGYAYVK